MTREEASALVTLVNVELCASAMAVRGLWAIAENDPARVVYAVDFKEDDFVVNIRLYGWPIFVLRTPPVREAAHGVENAGFIWKSTQWEELKWRIGLSTTAS